MRRLNPDNLRAAWWAFRAARVTRRLLTAGGLDMALPTRPPPALPDTAVVGVRGVLRRRRETCLVRAIVVQAWEAAHGRRRDLIVGVTGPDGFRAHAWLEGDKPPPPDRAELELALVTSAEHDVEAIMPPSNGGGDPPATGFRELFRRPAP